VSYSSIDAPLPVACYKICHQLAEILQTPPPISSLKQLPRSTATSQLQLDCCFACSKKSKFKREMAPYADVMLRAASAVADKPSSVPKECSETAWLMQAPRSAQLVHKQTHQGFSAHRTPTVAALHMQLDVDMSQSVHRRDSPEKASHPTSARRSDFESESENAELLVAPFEYLRQP
jgi:hypothetical protein